WAGITLGMSKVWPARVAKSRVCYHPKTRPGTMSRWSSVSRYASGLIPARTAIIGFASACQSSQRYGCNERCAEANPANRQSAAPEAAKSQSVGDRIYSDAGDADGSAGYQHR